jgi:Erv1 / Alr family
MGLCPKSFGPYFWGAFHLACLANVDKEALKTFIETYQMVLPCFGCRMHFSQLLAEYPIPDQDVFRWSVDIHNIVNQRIDKPVMSYEDALAHWLSGCEPEKAPEPEPLFDSTTILLMVLLVILIIAILFRR